MDADTATALVAAFFADLSAGGFARARPRTAPGFSWTVAGFGAIEGSLEHLDSLLERPLAWTLVGTTAQGDRVAVEAESHGRLRDGTPYANRYHFLVTLRGASIAAVREYSDTRLAADVWGKYFQSLS